jgi:hypothetical protein
MNLKILLIKANIITIQKKFSHLFSLSVNLLSINLAYNIFLSILASIGSKSDIIELNKINIEGIFNKDFKSVLFNNANITIHN